MMMAEILGKRIIHNKAEEEEKITIKDSNKAEKGTIFDELQTTMENLRLGKEKIQYHTEKDFAY